MKRSTFRLIVTIVVTAAIVVILCYIFTGVLFNIKVVSGSSMEPYLYNGERVIVDIKVYEKEEVSRYDVIVFDYRYLKDTYYIKRVIGLPGETIQIVDGKIFVNYEELPDVMEYGYIEDPGIAIEPIVLGEDEYFVLGDNIAVSEDSRSKYVASVAQSEIIGKVIYRWWPLERMGRLEEYNENGENSTD